MIQVGAAIVVVWGALLGVAYLSRSAIAVVGCYLVLCALALFILGAGWQGWTGAVGMLPPCVVAAMLARVAWGPDMSSLFQCRHLAVFAQNAAANFALPTPAPMISFLPKLECGKDRPAPRAAPRCACGGSSRAPRTPLGVRA